VHKMFWINEEKKCFQANKLMLVWKGSPEEKNKNTTREGEVKGDRNICEGEKAKANGDVAATGELKRTTHTKKVPTLS